MLRGKRYKKDKRERTIHYRTPEEIQKLPKDERTEIARRIWAERTPADQPMPITQ